MVEWFAIWIVAPIFLPFAFTGLLLMTGLLKSQAPDLWKATIGSGQLAWLGLGMSVGALYEQRRQLNVGLRDEADDVVFWTLILVLLLQAAVAATAPLIAQSRSHESKSQHMLNSTRAKIASIVLLVSAASLYAVVHATRRACT
ncbi:hypothetical protein ABT364_13065 [Massilia sp. SR12]